jgi:hypothetical protein
VHSDTPNAIEILKALRDALSNKKITEQSSNFKNKKQESKMPYITD